MKFLDLFKRQASPYTARRAPLAAALEPRMLFDGAVAATVADAASSSDSQPTDTAQAQTADDTALQSHDAATPLAATSDQRQEVVFVDGQVANIGELLDGLSGNPEVVILDPNKDGLQQMADYLKGREGLDAIHLLSHGADGSVQMGNLWLSNANLAEHRAELESIGAALKADGDLMLYGCRVGETERGLEFIDQLARITGADVAASADDTGAAGLGGNWTLERSSGAIETTALGAQLQGYESLMAVTFSGGTSPSGPVLGTGQLARMVVGDFNNDGRSDILYQIGGDGTNWRFAAGNANGTFTVVEQAQSPFAVVTLINAVTNGTNYYAADFDKDGDIDLLGVPVGSATTYLYHNNNGVFTQEAVTSFGGTQYNVSLVVGDFDGDGAADILYQPGNIDPTNSWRYAKNNGDGTFSDVPQAQSPFAAFALDSYSSFNYRVIDFDGDGDLDIMWTANNSKGTLYINNGGTFALGSTTNFPTTPYGGRTLWGDFDGDGDADVLWQNGTNGSEWNYSTNNGDGTFATVARASSPFAGLDMVDYSNSNFRAGDFDGDGDLDVIGIGADGSSNVYYQAGTAPRLVNATPADNSLNVSPSANIVPTFSESVAKSTGNIYIMRTSDEQIVQTIAVGSSAVIGSGTTWTIDPPADLVQGTAYAVLIDSNTFVNADGKIYKGIQTSTALNFTTSTVQVPVIANLNGDSVSYTEGSAQVLLDQGGNATVSDADSSNFNGGKLTVQVTAGGTSGEDVLFVRNQGNGLNEIQVDGTSIKYNGLVIGAYTGGTNGTPLVITLTSEATAATTAALVQNLAYRNSNTIQPSTTDRSVSISMDDGAGGNSAVSVVSVAVLAANDAPVVNVTGTNPTYTENGSAVVLFGGTTINTVETGQLVKQVVFTVSNLADGSMERLTIDGSTINLVHGTNLVTLNNSATVTVSVMAGTATVTFSHSGLSIAGTQVIVNNMTYLNVSEAPTGSTRVVTLSSVSDNGGTTNGGKDTAIPGVTSTVTLVAVNDAPTLSGGPYALASVNEDTTTSGYLVSTVLAGLTTGDLDSGALSGIAITAASGRGTWQYSTDGSTWTNFGTVSNSSALLLTSTSQVRYIPDGANGENANLIFRAWDRTSGSASTSGVRSTADTTSNGGSTSFSTGTAQATLAVSSVNDAPVMLPLAPTLSGLTDTSTNNAGSSVLFLLGGVTDVDSGALYGMAITSLTATYGKWQYSTNAGGTWSDVGSVSVTSALMLASQNMVRFVPDGVHGETASITYKAWDQTNSTLGFQGIPANTTTSGGTSAYSSLTDTASVIVTAVNDAPTMTSSSGTVSWTEGNNTTSIPVVIDNAVSISDADGPGIASATVRISNNYSNGNDFLALVSNPATMGNIIGTWDAANATLTLSSAGNLASQAQFQAALRAVTFTNLSQSPTLGARTVEFRANDGSLDSAGVTRTITISAVDDTPLISVPASTQVVEDFASVINLISISDLDSVNVYMTLNVGSGTLAATSGAGVVVGGNATTMNLSGTIAAVNAFIANNRVTYTTAANATADVTLTITVDTGSVGTDTKTMTLSVTPVNDAPVATVPVSIAVTEDLASSLTGISFSDVDAGSASVTATFSVPSGILSAISGSGVTVADSGTSTLTLSGSLSDINAFIAAASVKYQTALDNTSSVLLTVSINDNGNTGGSALTDTKTVIINVIPVNDAPVNAVQGDQTVKQDAVLTFNSANGNLVSISDVDSDGSPLIVTLTATNGLINLSSNIGLAFHNGNVPGTATLEFEGSLAQINAALNGMKFTPTPGYNGPASFTIISNDQGATGSGGVLTDTDSFNITVQPLNPGVTNVSILEGNRAYKVGETVNVAITFDMNVTVAGGVPTLLLETGVTDRFATYVSGSGTNSLIFSYTVQAGDLSADLDYHSTAALQLNGATLKSAASDDALLTLPTLGGANSIAGQKAIVIDGVVPTISSVTAPPDGTYITGQNLDFTVNFSENVLVSTVGGIPRIEVTLDTGGTVYADYVSGSGSSALVFRLTVASGQMDSNGISLGNAVLLSGGSIRDSAGNDTGATLNSVASTAGVLVDAIAPDVSAISLDGPSPTNASSVTFTVTFSEDVSGVDLNDFSLSTNGSVSAALQSVLQLNARTYQVTVDSITGLGGLAVMLNTNGSAIVDSANNPITGTFTGPAYTIGLPPVTTPDVTGDPEFRANPPGSPPVPPSAPLQPTAPSVQPAPTHSPLMPPALFEVPTLGSGIPTLGNIFINNGALSPSFIAQVFGSNDSAGNGSGSGFLGFGGGDSGVFGSSTLSSIFGRDALQESSPMQVFDGKQWRSGGDISEGLRGVFGAPTLGQQLHDLNEGEQRHLRELALALGQFEFAAPNA